MSIPADLVKQLRQRTGAGVLDCRKALEEAQGDLDRAESLLREKGLAKAASRAGRVTRDGVIDLYSHGDGRLGVMVEVNCETDFVARTPEFRQFAHEMALQVAANSPLGGVSMSNTGAPAGGRLKSSISKEPLARPMGSSFPQPRLSMRKNLKPRSVATRTVLQRRNTWAYEDSNPPPIRISSSARSRVGARSLVWNVGRAHHAAKLEASTTAVADSLPGGVSKRTTGAPAGGALKSAISKEPLICPTD